MSEFKEEIYSAIMGCVLGMIIIIFLYWVGIL